MKKAIGEYKGKDVKLFEDTPNKHLGILGRSGTGKSTFLSIMADLVAKEGGTVVVLDLNGDFCAIDNTNCQHIYVADGVNMPIFTKMCSNNGRCETDADVVENVENSITRQLMFGCRQKSELRGALEYMQENGYYQSKGIAALDEVLESSGTPSAERVREELQCLTERQIFVDGPLELQTGTIYHFDFGGLAERPARIADDIILATIKRKAWMGEYERNEIFVLVDEAQHFISGRDPLIPELLAEGRKYGVNVVWATQSLGTISRGRLRGKMLQSATELFFRPADDELETVARIINPANPGKWIRNLRDLKVGQCVAVGGFTVGGYPMKVPIRVNISSPKGENDLITTTEEVEIRDGQSI